MTWKKILTNNTSKYYFTVQNISVIPNSKVYLKIKDTDTPPTDTNGAIVLTSKNYLSSVLPTNSYMYVAEENGGLAGTIVSEVINQTNFNIQTVHEDKVLTTVGTVVSIPKGALFVLQNKSENDIQYKVSNQSGRGVLVKNQIFAIAFARDTKVTVTGTAGDTFTYIITASVNMTVLDDQLQEDINYIKAHLKTVNTKYITIDALEQVYSQLGRGSFTDEFDINGNNTIEHTFDTVKLNPVDKTITKINDRSVVEVIGDITFTNRALPKTDKTAFSFTVSTDPEDNSINDIFIANKAIRNHIEKIYIRRNTEKDKLQLVLVTSHNFESSGKFRIRIDGYKLLKENNPLDQTAATQEVIYKHDNLEFYSDEDRAEIHSNLVENVNPNLFKVDNFNFNYDDSTATKLVFKTKDPSSPPSSPTEIDGFIVEFNEANGELFLYIHNKLRSNIRVNKRIDRIFTIGKKRGLSMTIPVWLFTKINEKPILVPDANYIKYKVPLHEYVDINKGYGFYKTFFKNIYDRLMASKDEPELINECALCIHYI